MARHAEPRKLDTRHPANRHRAGSCPACGSSAPRSALEKFGEKMARCPDCGLMFTHPLPDPSIVESRYSDAWFETEYLPSYGVDPLDPRPERISARFSHDLDLLEPYRRLNRVLDVGAGAGLFLWHARNRGWKTEGVEISEFGPRFARERFGLDIFRGTLDESPFDDGIFDAVVLQDILEHVPDPRALMLRVNGLVRMGGAVLVSTPNYDGIARRLAGERWAMISPLEHLCLFNRRSLRDLLSRTGFGIATLETAVGHDTPETAGVGRRALKAVARRLGLGNELYCTAIKNETPARSPRGIR